LTEIYTTILATNEIAVVYNGFQLSASSTKGISLAGCLIADGLRCCENNTVCQKVSNH